jgi:hypothetical protein
MKYGWRSRRSLRPQHDPDLDSALDAMTAEELRSFVRDALERLDDEPRSALVDSLIARAATGSSGWRPSGPSRRIVDEVKCFAEAARRVGYAEPQEVDDYLRQGTRAFLAGEHATARGILEALLPPIAELIAKVRPAASIDSKGREVMLEAMRAAATKRVERILGNKRRRHYGHAATLVACCLELAPAVGRQKAVAEWVDQVRKEYSRFYAFQEELKSALASPGFISFRPLRMIHIRFSSTGSQSSSSWTSPP